VPLVTEVIAHRGASRMAHENTLAAFEMAAIAGADGVELDVRRTVDGVLVVHHDARVSDGRVIDATSSHISTNDDWCSFTSVQAPQVPWD